MFDIVWHHAWVDLPHAHFESHFLPQQSGESPKKTDLTPNKSGLSNQQNAKKSTSDQICLDHTSGSLPSMTCALSGVKPSFEASQRGVPRILGNLQVNTVIYVYLVR